MFSKDLSILFIFIAGQSNFETALATCCAALSNLKFVTAALVLKSLPTPGLGPHDVGLLCRRTVLRCGHIHPH